MQKLISFLSVAIFATILFTACEPKEPSGNTPTTDEGVVINGVKWATRNVGSTGTFVTNPEDYGNFYAWEDAKTACPSGWRLPTKSECESLINSGGTMTIKNGKEGHKFGDVFLPAAGCFVYLHDELFEVGVRGFYWSSTAESNEYAYYLYFDAGSELQSSYKFDGQSVRCVKN